MQCVLRTGIHTASATDALCTVGRFINVYTHFALFRARTAVGALILIYTDLYKTNLIEQRIKSAQWADVFAKRPVDENGADKYHCHQEDFPFKQ